MESNEELYVAKYQSSPYIRITQPDSSEIMLSMAGTDLTGTHFSRMFYPTQDGIHLVNVTARDLAGNYAYAETWFDAFVPPEVSNPKPGDGAFTTNETPKITADLWDYSGVDASSVIVRVNGVNVTADAVITPTSVEYIPTVPLGIGPVTVSIIAADIYGNAMPEPFTWIFTILEEPPSPMNLRVVVSEDDLVLTWNAPFFSEASHYQIYRSFTRNPFDFTTPYHSTIGDLDPLSTTFIDFDAASDWRTMHYAVRIVDINNKNDSNENIVWNGEWIVLTNQFHENIDAVINGNISIREGGELTLSNFTARMNSNEHVNYTIEATGKFLIPSSFHITNNSEITSASSYIYDVDIPYYCYFSLIDSKINQGRDFNFYYYNYEMKIENSTIENFEWIQLSDGYVEDGSYVRGSTIRNIIDRLRIAGDISFTQNTFSDCGVILIRSGSPYFEENSFINNAFIWILWGSSPYFYNNTIADSTQRGIVVHDSYPIIEKTTFTNNPTGIKLDDQSWVNMINCTITGGTRHIVLDDNSRLTALNTTFDRSKVEFYDDSSTLTIKWFMHVFVKDLVDDPVPGAQVTIENVTGEVVQTGLTGPDGFLKWMVCTECVMNKTETWAHTPHTVRATKDLIEGFASPDPIMDISKRVDVILGIDVPPPPPLDFKIEIIGNDIRLSWQHPLTSDIDHYLIYRADLPGNIDFASPWMDTSVNWDNGIISLRTSWNDTGAAADSNNYFYVVRAVDGSGQNDSNTITLGKFVIPLVKSWNMVSIPFIQTDTSLSSVLSSITGLYNMVMFYNASDGKWHTSSSDLTDIDRTMALWIHMTETSNLVLIGEVPTTTTIELTSAHGGWNFISYPSFTQRTLDDVLSSITGAYDAVRSYENQDLIDPWKNFHIDKPAQMNDLEFMKPGCGYWIYVKLNMPLPLVIDG
jgi:hypothetical protein